MASGPPPSAAKLYRPNAYVSLPAELDPDTYDASPEKRRAEAERLAIRARLKRQYQLQLNNPNPPAVIDRKERLIKEGKYERPFSMF
ncbi:NADH dehydrogenase [Pitangus sulphuratus]|nr:NADH dehydrogenase [Pitangus sulphuratus]